MFWIRDVADLDPVPALFFFFSQFFCLLLSIGTFISFFKDKKLLRTHISEGSNQGFSKFVSLLMEGSGSVKKNYGFGYGRPENLRILRILLQIPNTGECKNPKTLQQSFMLFFNVQILHPLYVYGFANLGPFLAANTDWMPLWRMECRPSQKMRYWTIFPSSGNTNFY